MTFFLSVLGVVLIVEGVPYFIFPEKVKQIAIQLPGISNSFLRGLGLILMLAGLLIAYISTIW